jgi:CheY-like chemotaxis protein
VIPIDMRLPDGDGATVFRCARKAESPARTVLITGRRAELAASLERLLKEGADAVCYKPFFETKPSLYFPNDRSHHRAARRHEKCSLVP